MRTTPTNSIPVTLSNGIWRIVGGFCVCGFFAGIFPTLWETAADEPSFADSKPLVKKSEGEAESMWSWDLPPGFPVPRVPTENPMSEAKVRLGRTLFYDTRLSVDQSMSCGTCHRQELAFTDGLARPTGVTGELHPRSSMSLVNVAYNVGLTWDDPNIPSLEEQLTTPIFGHDPVEMGMERSEDLLARLRDDWLMELAFHDAFGPGPEEGQTITMDRLAAAIASFERTLISGNSAFDRFMYQDQEDALSPEARRGMRLFFSRRLGCSDCHRGFNFSAPIVFEGSRDHEPEFHNTGLYNGSFSDRSFSELHGREEAPELGNYPEINPGLRRHTGKRSDTGRFKAPSLRNIAVTAPYMHDGSVPDLDAVIDHYAAGGRAGDNPYKSEFVAGFQLSEAEREDLKAFFHALTDADFLTDPALGPP